MEKYCSTRQTTDDNMAHALCMLGTNTHSEYVMLIAFPRQKWLLERASVLRHTCVACLVMLYSYDFNLGTLQI